MLVLIIALFFINREVRKYGYTGVLDLVSTYNSNSNLAKKVEPKRLKLNISQSDYEFIEERRKIALDRGIQINDGNNYVPCKVELDGDVVEGEMRLKGHMTDHLEGDKWSFRVKTKDNIMGMYRFSLQHPGTRNYVYEWIYHQLLKYEGIIYLHYDFINLQLNDKDLGIYAVEEHFGQHILERNNRTNGAIIRWNPELYWAGRIDEFEGFYLNENYKNYEASFAEPYDKGTVLKDSNLLQNYLDGVAALEAFRSGIKTTSQVFDVDKMAKFHAIIDLVGGHHSLDWSDVKFYYNGETQKVEPVGYESFSIRKTEQIAGQQLYEHFNQVEFNYHAQLFKDTVFYKAYIQNLERIANEKYFKTFVNSIQQELDYKIGVLAHEWPYRKFDLDAYYENIRLIKNNLDLPKPLHVFTQDFSDSIIHLAVAPVSDFPIQIIELQQKDKSFKLATNVIIPPKSRGEALAFYNVYFAGKIKKAKNLVILAKIPGYSKVFEVEVAAYPYAISEFNALPETGLDTNVFVQKKDNIYLKNSTTVITKLTKIQSGQKLIVQPNQTLILKENLFVDGDVFFNGMDGEEGIQTKFEGGRIVINEGVLKAHHTAFTGLEAIQAQNAQLLFDHCQFYDLSLLLNAYQSNIEVKNCFGGSVNQIFALNQSELKLSSSTLNKGDKLMDAKGSFIRVIDSKISDYKNMAILNNVSTLKMWNTSISNANEVFLLKNASAVNTFGGKINQADCVVKVEANDPALSGDSEQVLYQTQTTNVLQNLRIN
ncbi:MAG: CotH kinase family protein [Putridiphycobacter sp.]